VEKDLIRMTLTILYGYMEDVDDDAVVFEKSDFEAGIGHIAKSYPLLATVMRRIANGTYDEMSYGEEQFENDLIEVGQEYGV
jgi:hypothetical protein